MKAALQKKQEVVATVAEKITKAKTTVVADYRGLSSKQTEDLRRQLKDAGVDLRVVKNTLAKRAATQAGFEGLDAYLQGPTALAFASEDPLAVVGVLCAFSRKNEALQVKGAILEGDVVGKEVLQDLSTVPSKEAMLAMFLSVLQSSMSSILSVLEQRAQQLEKEEGQEEKTDEA